MAQVYFADAWYFIALLDPRDTHHRNALRLQRLVDDAPIVTHEAILTEVLSYFAEDGSYARALAAQAIRRALIDLRVVSVDRALFTRALDLYERRSDKEYSLVDCISMVLSKDSGITYVLTNDHHFRQEGFTVLSDVP